MKFKRGSVCREPGIMPKWYSLNKCWFFEVLCQAVVKAAVLGTPGLERSPVACDSVALRDIGCGEMMVP